MLKLRKKFYCLALGVVVFQFGGCGINNLFSNLLQNAVTYTALEFLTDSDGGGFDLFGDDGPGEIV